MAARDIAIFVGKQFYETPEDYIKESEQLYKFRRRRGYTYLKLG